MLGDRGTVLRAGGIYNCPVYALGEWLTTTIMRNDKQVRGSVWIDGWSVWRDDWRDKWIDGWMKCLERWMSMSMKR